MVEIWLQPNLVFRGLIDEVRIWRFALGANNVNGSGGNGNPSENFPQSIAEYLNGRWSFTEFSNFNGIKSLEDRSDYNNHLETDFFTAFLADFFTAFLKASICFSVRL